MMPAEERAVRGMSLPLAFAFAVAMWAVGYVGRFPGVEAPPALLGTVFLLLYVAAGAAVRALGGVFRQAVAVGVGASAINLLILGSLLGERPGPSLAVAVPGALLAGAVLAGAGFSLARPLPGAQPVPWDAMFARVAVAATFLLVVAGGLVTSHGAGLAVPDWPNSFGSNMFLFPLSRMTGGVYYEHAHRLFGSLVGLTTLALAFYLSRRSHPRWVKAFAWGLAATVVVQGIFGGLRVTGRFTLAQDPSLLSPSLALAAVHGVLGQLFFSGLVALATVLSPRWAAREPQVASPLWPRMLWGLLVVQLVLGALQRHFSRGILVHITLATLVLLVAVLGGAGLVARRRPPLTPAGKALLVVVGVQVVLGFAAFWLRGFPAGQRARSPWEVLLVTGHQALGAVLLALATVILVWSWPSRVRG